MRTILGILLSLVFIGMLAYVIDSPGEPSTNTSPTTQWRRTADGWEKVSALWDSMTAHSTMDEMWHAQPHPIVLSLLMGLVSTFVLVAFCPAQNQRQRKPAQPVRALSEMPLKSCAWVEDSRLR